MTDALLVHCTFPSREHAEEVAGVLVSEALAACVSLSSPALSIYRWQGETCKDSEIQATIKTRRSRFEALRTRILELHSYDCPEILATPVELGHPEYLQWLEEQT